jgi:hypothetical protein
LTFEKAGNRVLDFAAQRTQSCAMYGRRAHGLK